MATFTACVFGCAFPFHFFFLEWARRGGDTLMDAPRHGPPEMSFLRKRNEKVSEQKVPWANNKCGTMRKAKISHCLLSPYWQKRTRSPFTGRRLSSIGSRSGVSSSSSTPPLRHWPILLFSHNCCLGIYFEGSVVSDCSGWSPRANLFERDASSEQRREKRGQEKNEVSRCKTPFLPRNLSKSSA